MQLQEQNQIYTEKDTTIEHLDKKLSACGSPTLLCYDTYQNCEHGLHRTCKLNHLCAFCARKFQMSFISDCKKIANHALENNKTLVFLTLTKKPFQELLLKEGLQEIKDNFYDFRRMRIGAETREEIWREGFSKYEKNCELQRRLVCEEKKLALDLSIAKQKYYYEKMSDYLETLQKPRFSDMFSRGVGRYEFKQQGNNHVYIHIHILLALNTPIPQNFISESWYRVSGCDVVHIKPIDHHEAEKIGSYIGKYMGKADGEEMEELTAWSVQKAITQEKQDGKFSAYRQKFWVGKDKLIKNAKNLTSNIPVALFEADFDGEKPNAENLVGKIFKTRKIASSSVFHYMIEEICIDATVKKIPTDKNGKQNLFTRCEDSTVTRNYRIEFWRTGKYIVKLLDENLNEKINDGIELRLTPTGYKEINTYEQTHRDILLTRKVRSRIEMIQKDRESDRTQYFRCQFIEKNLDCTFEKSIEEYRKKRYKIYHTNNAKKFYTLF